MGQMETWEVVGRTDDTMTFVYKRRCYKEETFPMSTGDSEEQESKKSIKKKSNKGLDESTNQLLKRLSGMCKDVRKKHRIENKKAKKPQTDSESGKSSKKSKSTTSTISEKKQQKRTPKKPEDLKSVKEDSDSDTDSEYVNVSGMLIKKGKKNEPCDHRGVPLSHPMAMTPYPGATTAAKREKARKMLKELAQKLYEEDLRKEGKLPPKKDVKPIASTAKAKSTKSVSVKSSASSVKSCKSSTKSQSSNKKMGCDKCGSCQKCIHRCSQKHPASVKVTDYEREQFLNGIKRLRQKIVKPERSRERADKRSKSPYDVTQSDSESDLSSEHSKSGKSSKRNSKEK